MSIDTTNLKEYRFSVDFKVHGDRALFSDPVTRIGGFRDIQFFTYVAI